MRGPSCGHGPSVQSGSCESFDQAKQPMATKTAVARKGESVGGRGPAPMAPRHCLAAPRCVSARRSLPTIWSERPHGDAACGRATDGNEWPRLRPSRPLLTGRLGRRSEAFGRGSTATRSPLWSPHARTPIHATAASQQGAAPTLAEHGTVCSYALRAVAPFLGARCSRHTARGWPTGGSPSPGAGGLALDQPPEGWCHATQPLSDHEPRSQ